MIFRIFTFLAALSISLAAVSCNSDSADRENAQIEMRKILAGELRDNKLYSAAVEEYQDILGSKTIETNERANINYLIARIYFDNLKDYKNAAAYYIRARTLDPQATFVTEASRNLVTSLERMGRMLDARRQLDEITNIDNLPDQDGDVAVARIGGVPIWLSDIENQIQSLPPESQKQFQSAAAKKEFVKSYVGTELLFRAAVRENFGDDPDVTKREQLFHRQLMIEKYIVEKVMPQIKIDTVDVRNYFTANKSRYPDKPYDSLRAQVFLDYQGEKTQSAYNEFITKLARVERVEFLEHNIK